MGINPWVIPITGKLANIIILFIMPNVERAKVPPKANKELFNTIDKMLIVPCLARVTEPMAAISFIIDRLILRSSNPNFNCDFPKKKNHEVKSALDI